MRLTAPNTMPRRDVVAYTIAEVIVAILVVGVLTISLYATFATGFAIVDITREDLRATQILMRKIEAIRLTKWSDLQNINFVESYDPLGATNNSGGVQYTGTLTISPADSVPDSSAYKPNLRLVTVSVTWTNYFGGRLMPHNRQVQTQVARNGMQNYILGK